MIAHAYVPHPVWKRDQCEFKFDDDGRIGFCGKPRSEHMDSEHGLRVQLATALRERDEARADAERMVEAAKAHKRLEDAAEAERDAARADVKRLREALQAIFDMPKERKRMCGSDQADSCEIARAALATGGSDGT